MNNICKTCDTRLRMKMCDGKDGEFKYCYRPVGSRENIPEEIFPFTTIDELYPHLIKRWGEWLIKESLKMEDYGCNMFILLGCYAHPIPIPYGWWKPDTIYPVGYITR